MPLVEVSWAAAHAWGVWACGSSPAWPCSGASVVLPGGPAAGVEDWAVFEEAEVPGEEAGRDPAARGERLSMECSSNTPLSPTTPLTTPDSEAGTSRAEVLTTARA